MKKKTLAKYYVIGLLFLMGNLLLYNCQKEDFFTKTTETVVTQSKKYNVQKLGSKELQEDTEIGMALQKVRNRFKRNVANQAATERSVVVGDGLIILDDEVAKIEVDNTITWTFKIETPTHETSEIENFMIKKHNNEFTYFLIKYKHSNENPDDPYRATLEKINGNALDTSNINFSSRDAFDWEFGDGGGGDDDCEGIIVDYELQACNQGGTHTAGTFCCQHPEQHGCEYVQNFCGDTCNGTSEVPIRDFSHCDGYGGPTGDPVDGDNPNDNDLSGGSTGGSSGSGDDDNDNTVTTLVDPRCQGDKVMINDVCQCPVGRVEDPEDSNKCICEDGYDDNGRNRCVKEGSCFELDKLMHATSTSNPYIQGATNDPTGENTHIRLAIINMYENLDSNWEHGYGFYNRGNFPSYGPYAHHVPAQGMQHVRFPKRVYQFGTIHTHPINDDAIPMFSAYDLYSLLDIRNTYTSSSFYNSNNPAGDDLFVHLLAVKQGGDTHVYAIKIYDIAKLQNLESIFQDRRKKDDFIKLLNNEYSDNANGVSGSALAYQKVFLQFVQDQDLGLDLYKMGQLNNGTPNVEERWHKLTLNSLGTSATVDQAPCTNS